ncbi:MAG: PRD domain-containing protein [Rouxiella aceris]|jgi:PRD domain protein (TIGR03582 family)|uniref:PRD domain-containing protein n=1 Tax=Rouxiella aceris TaxID=2703884 RepID=A0A848MMS0_9GAMM|nr:PRD domain-containing protein [Rouxiella aceris]MDR3430636.1 PRD domain-containing protein [Rouxiella aceris]NMP28593.1 PRD domain-containing protein [Rouxiella aceris]
MNNALEIKDAPAITEKLLTDIQKMLNAENIFTNDVQQQMLTSHVKAMVLRSITGEPLPEVEKELFDEISSGSMKMAEQVVDMLGNLPIEEAYLLSVHFEVAKDNNNL